MMNFSEPPLLFDRSPSIGCLYRVAPLPGASSSRYPVRRACIGATGSTRSSARFVATSLRSSP